MGDDWKSIVESLFGKDPLFPTYHKACLDKDVEKAKQLIGQGAFAEHTYLWNEESYLHICGMDGCFQAHRFVPFVWLLQRDRKFVEIIIDLGLIEIEKKIIIDFYSTVFTKKFLRRKIEN
jgi:hypothetical protein